MAFFLSIECKRLSSDTVIGKALTKYITEQEAYQIEDFQEAINELERSRENIRLANTEKKEGVLNVYYRYYALLSAMERRVPVNENEVRVQFNWYDIYKQKKAGRYSVNYEKACLLFNMATIFTQIAVLENLENPEGVKNACKFFRLAAGTFEQLKEFLESFPAEAITIDLCADSLLMFSNLMLAQAQELYYMMALKGNKPASVISKLAAQASDFYSTALEGMNSNSIKLLLPKRWFSYAELKRDIMKAVAQYQTGKEKKEAKAYGEELGRYRIALKVLEQGYVKNKGLIPEMGQLIDDIIARVKNAERSSARDNDLIYHESVPPEHKMPPLGKKAMVKSERIPPESLECSPKTDPFAKLIPFKARKADSVYSERKAQLLRDISKLVEDQNSVAKNTLHGMGLPGALEALETPHGIPISLLKKMDIVKKEGGVSTFAEKLETLHKMASEVRTTLDQAIALIDEEEKDDANMKAVHTDKWLRTPSHALTSNLIIEGQKHRANLEHAIKSDGYIQAMINENKRGIDLLCSEQGQILQLLPETSRQDVSITTLKQLLKQLDQLIYVRETSLGQLKEALAKDEIIEKLIKAQESVHENIFAEELRKHHELINKIKESLNQDEILNLIKEENNNFLEKRSANEQLVQRQQVLQEFEVAFSNYNLLKDHFSEGIQFYTTFQEILNKFKIKCSDFVLARNTEKQDLLQQIQSRPSANYIVTTTTTTSPPVLPSLSQQQQHQQRQQQQQQQEQAAQQPTPSHQPQSTTPHSPLPPPPLPPPYQSVVMMSQAPPPYHQSQVGVAPVHMIPVMMSRPGQQPQISYYPTGSYVIPPPRQQQQQQQKPSAFPPNPYNM